MGCRVLAAVASLALNSVPVMGQDSHLAYLPMTFHAEAQAIRTTACLQVTERIFSQPAWWERRSANGSGPEATFQAVITAIKGKDRPALLKLSDPTQAKDSRSFDQQATAYFQEFAVIALVAVPRA